MTTANDNKKYNTNYYNLDVVISIGFRVNSDMAIQFRRWSINVLKEFAKKGYIIDKKRMENGTNELEELTKWKNFGNRCYNCKKLFVKRRIRTT